MHLKPVHFKLRHAGKRAHLCCIAFNAGRSGSSRGAVFVSRGASGQHQRSRHAFQVPLEGAANCLVKVVDVEDQPPIGRSEGAEVAHMRVAAELAYDAGRRKLRQIRGHHRRRAAKVAERRHCHQFVLELNQRRHAAAHRACHQFQSGGRPRLGMQRFMLVAAHLFAPRLAKRTPFFRSCPVHTAEHTPSTLAAQYGSRRDLDFPWKPAPLSTAPAYGQFGLRSENHDWEKPF